jgi:phosphatidylglycerophosphate synthase
MLKGIVFFIIIARLLTGAGIFYFARKHWLQKYFLVLFISGFFSDFLDGFLCRLSYGIPRVMGILDGWADTVLFLASFYYLTINYPNIMWRKRKAFCFLIILFLISNFYCFVKFGRPTSYHTYSAKLWGLTIFLFVIEVAVFQKGVIFPLVLIAGLLNSLEEISITYTLPYWKNNITSFRQAQAVARKFQIKKRDYENEFYRP